MFTHIRIALFNWNTEFVMWYKEKVVINYASGNFKYKKEKRLSYTHRSWTTYTYRELMNKKISTTIKEAINTYLRNINNFKIEHEE